MSECPSIEQLSQLTGCVVRAIEPEPVGVGGRHSNVFALESDRGDLILRICKGDQGYYTRYFPDRVDQARWVNQEWATREARRAGVPAPEIIATDRDRRLVVMHRLPGVAIDHEYEDWQGCPYDEEQFGAILKRLHAVEPTGCGPIDDTGNALFLTWSDFLVAAATSAIATCLGRGSIPEDLGRELEKRWVPELEKLSVSRPALLHMESLGFANLMYDPKSRTVTGLLDYEDCIGGDPLFEMVWMRYYFEHDGADQVYFDFSRFEQGYGHVETDSERALIYWPFTYLEKLRWIEPACSRAQSYWDRLRGLVK